VATIPDIRKEWTIAMRLTTRVILSCLVSAASLILTTHVEAQEAKKAPKAKLVRAARLADVKAGKLLKDQGLWVEGDRIREVGPIEDVRKRAPAEAEEIDLGDATILPGLIDCHTHLLQNYKRGMGDDPNMVLTVAQLGTTRRALLGVAMAREALEAGFTTVRDLGNSGVNGDVALRDAIQAGWVVGPRIVASSRPRCRSWSSRSTSRSAASRRPGAPCGRRSTTVPTASRSSSTPAREYCRRRS
jgi:imidazolonepropionase-like amidohydrolase